MAQKYRVWQHRSKITLHLSKPHECRIGAYLRRYYLEVEICTTSGATLEDSILYPVRRRRSNQVKIVWNWLVLLSTVEDARGMSWLHCALFARASLWPAAKPLAPHS